MRLTCCTVSKAQPCPAVKRAMTIGDRSFAKDESGAIAIIFAILIIPMLLMIGAAIDYSRIALDRSQTQSAIDAAALAMVKKIALLDNSKIEAMVRDYINANIPSDIAIEIEVTIERNPSALKIAAIGTTNTTFMRIANINSSSYNADSKAVASDKSIEVALVLDNSGSMKRISDQWSEKSS